MNMEICAGTVEVHIDVSTESESDSIEIVDEFPRTRRRTDILKDLYDGKWMEAKQGEFSNIDLKAKSAGVEDGELQSMRKDQMNVLHEKVERRLKQLDIICAMPEKHRPAKLSDDIEAALIPYPKSEVLIHKFNIKITRRDIATLNSPNWLNDEVINFYMNLIMDRSMKNKRLPRVYVFSTFFYPKLYQSGHKSVDIFTYDILLIPIHLDVHWCMATVDFRKRCISYYDSMLGDNPECLKLILEYLEAEHLDKKKTPYKTAAWKLECPKNIPEQMNGSDCGVFSCTFAEFKSRLSPLDFTQEDMPYFRQRMVYEIIKGELLEEESMVEGIEEKREYWRR
ncbi:Sentrin-specific protease 1 [Portunus trituberculatus]|uniref:Sentrin-specific protease 1 n=1 Tax=Portunus trituberculatus TaxID=210409 RepID=A0A5B7E324_PORTR|nr:Sentrin-specific protease 1 [Portunus trituberculatus]